MNYLRSTKREGIENLLNFLEKSDFYTAPASTRFHGNYEGGLLEHSMKVYEIFKEKIKASGLSTPEDTVIIAPLLHDICKTNYYKVDYRNAKNARGEWEKVPYYAVEDTIPYGHGEKSVMMITEYMKLTNEKNMRFVGIWASQSQRNCMEQLEKAYKKYPIALLLNEADLEATYFYNI